MADSFTRNLSALTSVSLTFCARIESVTEVIGRREANKRATRSALQDAASRLFAEHGFGGTTVRDIADAAGVTERTFFRYFAGKEELMLDDILEWLPGLQQGDP